MMDEKKAPEWSIFERLDKLEAAAEDVGADSATVSEIKKNIADLYVMAALGLQMAFVAATVNNPADAATVKARLLEIAREAGISESGHTVVSEILSVASDAIRC